MLSTHPWPGPAADVDKHLASRNTDAAASPAASIDGYDKIKLIHSQISHNARVLAPCSVEFYL